MQSVGAQEHHPAIKTRVLQSLVTALSLWLALCCVSALAQTTNNNAGIIISNQARASYKDDGGTDYTTVSPTITLTISAVAGIAVTPDETQPSGQTAQDERITRVFRVCNTGNGPDSFQLIRAEVTAPATLVSLHLDLDNSGTVTSGDVPFTLNTTTSPVIPAGECASVLAVVDTGAVPVNSNLTISITARSTFTGGNGAPQDDGTIINSVGAGVIVTDPGTPALPPLKLVENKASVMTTPGSVLTYSISFRNRGTVIARNVLLSDDLPSEIDYLPGTMLLGTRALTDVNDADEGQVINKRIEVRIPQIAPDEMVILYFQARLNSAVVPGVGIINTATVGGENIRTLTRTSEAVAVTNPLGVVYAGYSGGSVRIPNARVVLTTDQAGTLPVALTGSGFDPNTSNANPFQTNAQGNFNFALSGNQLGSPGNPATRYLNVTAQGYRPRVIELILQANSNGLYAATIRGTDGQPIAQSGGFALTDATVSLDNLAALVLNIPMFETATLELAKSADRQQVEIGGMASYRVEAHNATSATLSNVTLTDTLPPSFNYVSNSARIQVGSSPQFAIEPTLAGNVMTFQIGQIGAGERVLVSYRVRVGANARPGQQINTVIGRGTFPSGTAVITPPAKALVMVGAGVFSMRQVILGRVFEDTNSNGLFDKGERPVEGARVYLNNGQSVITDSQGQYNFPAVEDGASVISLDPITVPKGYALHDNDLQSGRSWTRLLRTPLGGGALLRMNFGLRKVTNAFNDTVTDIDASLPEPVATASAESSSTLAAEPVMTTASGKVLTRKGPKTRAGIAAFGDDHKAGVYTSIATDKVDPIAPGDLRVLSPEADEVILDPALKVEAQVAQDYTVALEVDGVQIPEANIGAQETDRKNKVTTIVYVGVALKPGPNKLKITAIAPDGTKGRSFNLSVMGRGPARRLTIVTDKDAIASGGRDSTYVRVKAWDQWGNPSLDGQVAVEVSAGRLLRRQSDGTESARNDATVAAITARGMQATDGISAEGLTANQRQQLVPIENGEAVMQLIGEGAPGQAEIIARTGELQATGNIRITPELRPQILVGLAEASFGKAAPENSLRNEDKNYRAHTALYFRGPTIGQSLLTLSYNSFRPLTRTSGRDRMFMLDPLDRVYPVFGDNSTRFEDAQSNSKLYARLDRGRSYAMFGDFDISNDRAGNPTNYRQQNLGENLASSAIGMNGLGMNRNGFSSFSNAGPQLTGYARRLTGVKLHLENERGDAITASGARPDTAFARDVIPGGSLSLLQLTHTEVLQGSETIVLEVRDRRNPEIILSRDTLIRSVDYNLDPDVGVLYLLRPVSTFDYALNLVQLVATYEYRSVGMSSAVYTARGTKTFTDAGLRVGASFINQRQDQFGSYYLGGVDLEQRLPLNGLLQFEWGMSDGRVATSGNLLFSGTGNALNQDRHGHAFRAELRQPLPFSEGVFQANFTRSAARFLNPFGATITPGSQRASVAVDLRPAAGSTLRVGFTDERNQTETFNNERQTVSAGLVEQISDRFRLSVGYDYRSFTDHAGNVLDNQAQERQRASHLVTAGAEFRPTDKLQLAVKREQNLTDADPSYPNQTTIAAGYQMTSLAKIFFTQRLAANAITPISDLSATGFAAMASRRETAIGVETSLGRFTSLNSRYQLENGINGTDSFAVIGLVNRLPLRKNLSLDLGYERGLHLAGNGQSFNNAALGFSFQPTDSFRSSGRYELRDQNGFGNIFTFGAAGKIKENLTSLGRWQYARADFGGRGNRAFNAQAAMAWRPLESDRTALLFSYTRRSFAQSMQQSESATLDRDDTLSADGLFQATRRLELYGRFALRHSENGRADIPLAATLTMLGQGRAEFRFARYFDIAGEGRSLWQPASASRRNSFGAELGMWVMPDLRVAGGYNFSQAIEPGGLPGFTPRRGFYVAISSKLSRMFNLFGTAREGLVALDEAQTDEYLAANYKSDDKPAAGDMQGSVIVTDKPVSHSDATAPAKASASPRPSVTSSEKEQSDTAELVSQPEHKAQEKTEPPPVAATMPAASEQQSVRPRVVETVTLIAPAVTAPVAVKQETQPIATNQPVPPDVPTTNESISFTVQIGSHRQISSARKHAAQLKAFGVDARIVKADVPGRGLWYRVQSGQFASLDAANEFGQKLREQGALVNYVIADSQTTDPISQ